MFAHLKTGRFDSSTWTDLNDQYINAYQKSKTIAEKAAWEFMNDLDDNTQLELSVVNPGAVLGPVLSNDITSESLNICTQLLTKKMPGIPNLTIPMVDVRDVAKHHFQAMIHPDAKNKRIISALSTPTHFMEFAKTLKENGYDVPTKKVPTLLLKFISLFDREARGMLPILDRYVECDNSETIQLFNWNPMPLKDTFLDMAKSVQSVLDTQRIK